MDKLWLIGFFTIFTNPTLAVDRLRIVGGNETSIEKHPWQVSIQFLGIHFCAGSIISPSIIVTAAHCITELIARAYQIIPGSTDLRDEMELYRVDEYLIHADYDSETYDYDIAIIMLTENLNFTAAIQPIELPDEVYEIPSGTTVVASGWGVTEAGGTETSTILREVELTVVAWETCNQKLSSYNDVTERMLCAGYEPGGRDTCQADSGGALELNGTLIGITSWGESCGARGLPGVYTDVRYFRSWITEHTGL